jgi:hypothetical protein
MVELTPPPTTRREDYGVFNDRTAPVFRYLSDDDWEQGFGKPQFTGSLWECRQFARHFTAERARLGTLETNGPMRVMCQVVTLTEWTVIADDEV